MLEINPLLVPAFANIFSHSVGFLYFLYMVAFSVQELLSLIKFHLFIFVFIFATLGPVQKDVATVYVRECHAYVFL